MFQLSVTGTPIGGEDSRENDWVQHIAHSLDAEQIVLQFRIAEGRKVDLDNLVRPALRGLKEASLFDHGFKKLHSITATKEFDDKEGLLVKAGYLKPPTESLLLVESTDHNLRQVSYFAVF